MTADMFHLGWFFDGASPQCWGMPFTGSIGSDWMGIDFPNDLARTLERGRFDYVLVEDSSYIGDAYKGTMQIYLEKCVSVPRQDPAVVAGQMITATSRIGIVPTLTTTTWPPYLLARLLGTLDQISGGRVGWNVVTGSSHRAAQNFGAADLIEHDRRYDMADEYLEVVNALWDSWAPDAIVDDQERGVFADWTKVSTIDHEGEFFSVRGPLNSGPLPQGRPAIAQAGGSDRGRRFAADHAQTVVSVAHGVEAMKAFRDDVRARAAAAGRDPDSCKVMFLVTPLVGATEAEAADKVAQREHHARQRAEFHLAHFSKLSNIDFGAFDLDEPLGDRELTTNGHQQTLEVFVEENRGKTLREAAVGLYRGSIELVGTPDSVAAQMDEAMSEIGGDGFLLYSDETSRRYLAEIVDGLVPELQRRGLTRSEYAHPHLTGNLLAF